MSFRSNTHSVAFTSHVVRAVALAAALAIAPAAHAVTQYWDTNGSSSGLGGAGTWSATASGTGNWNDSTGTGPQQDWADGNDAVFNGTASYIVTQTGNFAPNSLDFGVTAGNVRITGGTLTIGSPTNSIVLNTNTTGTARAQVIESAISGTNITVVPNVAGTINASLIFGASGSGATNTFTGDLIFAGPNNATVGLFQIHIDNPTALPASATVRMRRNLSQLLFAGGSAGNLTPFTATYNNNIVLNDNVGGPRLTSAIGAGGNAALSSTTITLGGVVSGDANLIFQVGNGGGQGTIVLANNATYTGSTNLSGAANAIVRLGVNNALPVGTTFSVNRTFDMNGLTQKVAGLTSAAVTGAISNATGTISALTIDGNVTGTYSGLIGATSPSILPGSNDNEALILAPTNTGTLTLTRGLGNTYSGGTTINGGKLIAGNDISGSQSATGSGAVAVNNGGTLGGNGGVGVPAGTGNISVASGGRIAPGLATGTTIGTLTALNALSLGSGSKLDMDLGAPAFGASGTSDRVDMPSTYGNFALTVPAAANSIGVNLGDPGGAAGNGTYTLMSFQAGQYTGSSNANQFFTSALPTPNSLNGATIAYHLADNSNVIQDGSPTNATRVIMTVTGGSNALTWTGGAGNGNWDVGTTANFNSATTGASSTFAGNDNVMFDDTGANTDPITIAAGGVQPNMVAINNSTATYTISGGDIKVSSLGGGGGLFFSGTGAATINSNYTAVGPITSNKSGAGAATINGAITAATSLTVNGGAMTLAGANTYTGNNTVNGGTLTASGASATFGGGNVTVNAGSAAISAGVVNAILNSATLTLLGGGTAAVADAGFINLASGINEQVAALVLGTTPQATGTYGATGSGATNINDEYFLGLGIISVVAPGLPGDFNSDGKVDAGDHVTWRKANNTNNALANDNGLGTPIGPAHYNLWRANFGKPPGTGSILGGPSVIPEPSSLMLLLLAAVGCSLRRGRVA